MMRRFLAVLPALFINEVAWMGTPVSGVEERQWWRYEWVELSNAQDAAAVLDGWVLELHRDKPELRISLSGSIPSKGYFLIGASDKIPNVDLNYANLGGKFVNTGQKIALKNAKGEIVDEIDARSGWPAGDNESKRTMERAGTRWQTSAEPGGTPKAQNSRGFQEEKPPFSSGDRSKKLTGRVEMKKDPGRSSQTLSDVFRSPLFPASLLAGASALVMVALRRRFPPSGV